MKVQRGKDAIQLKQYYFAIEEFSPHEFVAQYFWK
jgi:hypothetical protein